ncbi:MAG TPA: tetratricopeptide repeat protein, partial [Caulifigura sp.]|nr:tetratricopeptide repeat protein [Caulifigura sp.]
QSRRIGWVAVWMACGLMAKSMVVTLPFVLLLLDLWPLRRWTGTWPGWRLIIEKWPLFLLTAAGCVLAIYTQAADEAIGTLDRYPLPGRLATTVMNYGIYLRQMFWPYPLVALSPHVTWRWLDWRVWSVLALLAAVTVVAVRQRSVRPWLFVGWSWFLGVLVPVIGLVQIGEHSHADRYMYLPLIGLAVAVVWLVAELVAASRISRQLLGVVSGVVLAACTVRTAIQIGIWRDSTTLWTYTLAHGAESATAHAGLGEALRDEGRFEEAIVHFRKALELWPELKISHTNIGWCLVVLGRLPEADAEFAFVLPDRDAAADEQFDRGLLSLKGQNPGRATAHFVRAILADPAHCRARVQLAVLLMEQQQYAAARREFSEAEKCDPGVLTIPGVREAIRSLELASGL